MNFDHKLSVFSNRSDCFSGTNPNFISAHIKVEAGLWFLLRLFDFRIELDISKLKSAHEFSVRLDLSKVQHGGLISSLDQ